MNESASASGRFNLALWTEQRGWPLSEEIRATLLETAERLSAIDGNRITAAKPPIDMDSIADIYLRLLCEVLAYGLSPTLRAVMKAGKSLTSLL